MIGASGALPDPSELLAVARFLSAPGPAPASDAQLRRAISTAYYALFHTILNTAAQRFMGPNQENTAAFSLIYRGFNHGKMRSICEVLQAATLKEKFKDQLLRTAASQEVRDFAGTFPELQDARHLADYDPSVQFRPLEASFFIDAAELEQIPFIPAHSRTR
jgi:hypothetical protein